MVVKQVGLSSSILPEHPLSEIDTEEDLETFLEDIRSESGGRGRIRDVDWMFSRGA